jgi:hypothetical protein
MTLKPELDFDIKEFAKEIFENTICSEWTEVEVIRIEDILVIASKYDLMREPIFEFKGMHYKMELGSRRSLNDIAGFFINDRFINTIMLTEFPGTMQVKINMSACRVANINPTLTIKHGTLEEISRIPLLFNNTKEYPEIQRWRWCISMVKRPAQGAIELSSIMNPIPTLDDI